MSEAAFRRSFDDAFLQAWGSAVGGVNGTYTSPTGTVTTGVHVLVDPAVDFFGDDDGQVSYEKALVSLFLAEVSPETGGTVLVDGDTYVLVKRTERCDESRSQWVARHG